MFSIKNGGLKSFGCRRIPYEFTYMCNLKNKINKMERLIDTENTLEVAREEGG